MPEGAAVPDAQLVSAWVADAELVSVWVAEAASESA
jgi:hypothetical protein